MKFPFGLLFAATLLSGMDTHADESSLSFLDGRHRAMVANQFIDYIDIVTGGGIRVNAYQKDPCSGLASYYGSGGGISETKFGSQYPYVYQGNPRWLGRIGEIQVSEANIVQKKFLFWTYSSYRDEPHGCRYGIRFYVQQGQVFAEVKGSVPDVLKSGQVLTIPFEKISDALSR